jgi:uncharacterized iron-regulated membrane protein
MYRNSRLLHRWVGIVAALFLIVIAITGFLLANKGRVAWLRTPVAEAMPVTSPTDILPIATIGASAFALGHPELKSMDDVDRFDYRPKDNVFKVQSKDGYREVQVCGKTGRVLSSSFRTDQMVEDIHDMSFFGDLSHAILLPLSALALFGLAASGIGLFFTPVVRRIQFRKRQAGEAKRP